MARVTRSTAKPLQSNRTSHRQYHASGLLTQGRRFPRDLRPPALSPALLGQPLQTILQDLADTLQIDRRGHIRAWLTCGIVLTPDRRRKPGNQGGKIGSGESVESGKPFRRPPFLPHIPGKQTCSGTLQRTSTLRLYARVRFKPRNDLLHHLRRTLNSRAERVRLLAGGLRVCLKPLRFCSQRLSRSDGVVLVHSGYMRASARASKGAHERIGSDQRRPPRLRPPSPQRLARRGSRSGTCLQRSSVYRANHSGRSPPSLGVGNAHRHGVSDMRSTGPSVSRSP